jgi:hypothetical protein
LRKDLFWLIVSGGSGHGFFAQCVWVEYHGVVGTWFGGELFISWHKGTEKGSEKGQGKDYSQGPVHSDLFLPAKFYLLNFPESLTILPPIEDQVFKT